MDEKKQASYQAAKLFVVHVWAAIGVVLLGAGIIYCLGFLTEALALLMVGTIIGFIITPITNWLEDHKIKRSIAAFLALIVFLAVIWSIGSLILPIFIEQAMSLARRIPDYSTTITEQINSMLHFLGQADNLDQTIGMSTLLASFNSLLVSSSQMVVTRLSTGILTNIISTINLMVIFFLGLVMAYWLSKDYPKIIREIAIIAGPRYKDDVILMFAVVSRSMGGYMRGVVIIAFVDGFFSFLGFLLIGHPYAGLMGSIVGILSFIPVVGPWVATIIAALVALFVSPVLAAETILVILVVQNSSDNLIYPLVMQSAVKVHPAISLLSIAIGASLGGALGMTFAIPLSAALKGFFVYYFEARTGRQLVSASGAVFKSTPFIDENGNPLPAFDALDDAKFFETSRLVPDPKCTVEPAIEIIQEKPFGKIVGTLQTAWKNSKDCKK